jgi:hypothetical protein
MTPKRVQRKRTKGWRMPEGAVSVARPSWWGNPWVALPTAEAWSVFCRLPSGLEVWLERIGIVDRETAIAECVRLYRLGIEGWVEDEFEGDTAAALEPLRGRDLACWCPLDAVCHADVLLELANRDER